MIVKGGAWFEELKGIDLIWERD